MAELASIKNYDRANEATVRDKCVCISVEFRFLGTSRKADMAAVTVDADKKRLSMKKEILSKSDNLDAIHRIWDRAYAYLWTKVLPSPLRKGMHLLPTELIEEVDEQLQKFEAQAALFIEALAEELEEQKRIDKAELREQYDERDYPTPDELKGEFGIDARYVDFRVPEKLRNIGMMFDREHRKDAESWKATEAEIKAFLLDTFSYLVDTVVGQLKVEKTKGKEKRGRIYDTTMAKLRQFIEDFPKRNVADDAALMRIVARAAKIPLDSDELKENPRVRQAAFEEYSRIQDELALQRPQRAISLE